MRPVPDYSSWLSYLFNVITQFLRSTPFSRGLMNLQGSHHVTPPPRRCQETDDATGAVGAALGDVRGGSFIFGSSMKVKTSSFMAK